MYKKKIFHPFEHQIRETKKIKIKVRKKSKGGRKFRGRKKEKGKGRKGRREDWGGCNELQPTQQTNNPLFIIWEEKEKYQTVNKLEYQLTK